MSLLAKTITGTGTLLDHLNDGAGRLVGLRCLASGVAQLTIKDADGGTVVDVDTYTAPTAGNPIDSLGDALPERIFAKNPVDVRDRELSYNGDFAINTGWTASAGGWVITGGVADCDGTQVTSTDLYQDSADFVDGQYYLLTFTMTRSAGTLTPYLNGQAGTARSAAGTFSEIIKASSTGNRLSLQAETTFVGTVDDLSIKLLEGDALLDVTSVTNAWQAVFELG